MPRLSTTLAKVGTEANVAAADPWNSGRPALFFVEDYMPVLRGRTPAIVIRSRLTPIRMRRRRSQMAWLSNRLRHAHRH